MGEHSRTRTLHTKIVLPNMSSVKLLKIQLVYMHVKQEMMLAQLKHLVS